MCTDGQCVKAISDCYSFLCVDSAAPYRCVSGICVSHPSECGTEKRTEDAQYLCGDGTWRNTGEYCPPIPACPKARPVRCSDGKCYEYSNNVCNNITASCSNPCADGICRDVCPTFNGCNINERVCLDGSCVNVKSSHSNCLGLPPCKSDEYHCGYGICVKSENECPLYHLEGTTMSNVLVRTGAYSTVTVALVDDEGDYFGILRLPHSYGLGSNGYAFIQLAGHSKLSSLEPPMKVYNESYLLTPMVQIIFLSHSFEIVNVKLPYNFTLIPYNSKISCCFAKVVNDHHWECISDIYNNPKEISAMISDSNGIYAIVYKEIFNEEVITEESSKYTTEWIFFIIILIAIILLVITGVYLLYHYCKDIPKMKSQNASYDVEIATKRKFETHNDDKTNESVTIHSKMNPILQKQICAEAYENVDDCDLEYLATTLIKETNHMERLLDEYYREEFIDNYVYLYLSLYYYYRL